MTTRSGRVIEIGVTGVLAMAALAVAASMVHHEFFGVVTRRPPTVVEVDDWAKYVDAGHRVGPVDAKITITEFSDFQCPYCRSVASSLDSVLARHPNDVAVVYRHFPLERLHPAARAAALASECASTQNRFEAFHDMAFARQDSLGKIPWVTLAFRAGIKDTGAFQRCLRDSVGRDPVRIDFEAGQRLRVTATPTILVNQWRLPGTPSTRTLESVVSQVLAGKKPADPGKP